MSFDTADKAYFDELETRSADARQAGLTAQLAAGVRLAKTQTAFYAKTLKDFNPDDIGSLADLEKLPVLNKSDLPELQSRDLPFAGLNAVPPRTMANIFRSPGPIWDASGQPGREHDYWKAGRGLFAAGIGQGDLVLNCFSYHWTPAGRMFESGAHAVGASVVPAGVGQTALQVEAIGQLGVTAYAGTPDFLQTILDKADETGADVSGLTKAVVSGGALFPAMRTAYQNRGIRVFQIYGTADAGIIAYESPGPSGEGQTTGVSGGMIINENMIVELLDPISREPVASGDVGEVVVTNFNPVYPLLRFATGDLSAVLPGMSSCGRTNTRLKGWMGRVDAITKVRGMFIHPSQVEKAVSKNKRPQNAASATAEVEAYKLVIDHDGRRDTMVLECVLRADGRQDPDLKTNLEAALAEACKIKGEVRFVASLSEGPGPIEDRRQYG